MATTVPPFTDGIPMLTQRVGSAANRAASNAGAAPAAPAAAFAEINEAALRAELDRVIQSAVDEAMSVLRSRLDSALPAIVAKTLACARSAGQRPPDPDHTETFFR